MNAKVTRRDFLKTATLAGVIPYLAFGHGLALAQTPQLDPAGAQARALEYTHKSSMADKVCANCKLYTGDASSEWGPCAIFPGKNVASAGWCKAWVTNA